MSIRWPLRSHDRLLDVDPYTYRLVPELAESWEVLDNGATYRFTCAATSRFNARRGLPPTRDFNADDVIFTFGRIFNRDHPWHNVNGSSFPYFDSLQFADSAWRASASWIIRPWSFASSGRTPRSSGIWPPTMRQLPLPNTAARLTQDDRQEQLDRQPVGTGPFQLIRLPLRTICSPAAPPGYWRGKPLMPQVVVDLGSGGTGRLSKLLTGECDVLAWPAASQLTILRDDPRLRLTLRPGIEHRLAGLQHRQAAAG